MIATTPRGGGSGLIAAPAAGMQNITANASAHTKGNYVVMLDPVPQDWCGFWLGAGAIAGTQLIDIAIGPTGGGGEQVIIGNILTSGGSTRQHAIMGFFPIRIPAGVRLSARMQSSAAGQVISIAMWGVPANPYLFPGYGRCTTLGANTADSGGQQIDPGATASTKGTYQNLTTNLDHDTKAIIGLIGDLGNEAMTTCTWDVDIARGGAGAEKILVPDWRLWTTTGLDQITGSPIGPVYVDIPAGSTLRARALCSITDATDRLFDLVLLCFA
jgi:hypothetical protein